MTQALFEPLPWDSEHFGCRVAHVRRGPVSAADVQALMGCDEVDCFYLYVDPSDLQSLSILNGSSVLLADVRVTMARSLSDPATSWSLQAASPRDMAELAAVAREGCRASRFHFDPRFAAVEADRLYERWVRSDIGGTADRVLVVRLESQAVGFIACHVEANQDGRIGLSGLSERARGQGLGSALVRGALAWFAQHRVLMVRTTMPGRNLDGQRLYQSQGFQTRGLELVYHLWPRKPLPLPATATPSLELKRSPRPPSG